MATSKQVWEGTQLVGTLIESPEAELIIDKSGVAGATLNFMSDFDGVEGLIRQRSRHPDFGWLLLKEARVRREEANACKVRITYEGVSDDGIVRLGGSGGSNPRYSLKGSTSTSPIETNPNFETVAGTAEDEKDGVEWDDKGNFEKFTTYLSDGSKNRKAGTTQWLQPGLIYEETVTLHNKTGVKALVKELGRISDPPKSAVLPTDLGNRNWLMADATAKQVGDGVELTRRWKLSGPNGWDEDWYSTFES